MAQRLSVVQVGGKWRWKFHPSEWLKVAGPVHPLPTSMAMVMLMLLM